MQMVNTPQSKTNKQLDNFQNKLIIQSGEKMSQASTLAGSIHLPDAVINKGRN